MKFTLRYIIYGLHGEVYSIQHYVIKFVSDLRQVGGFLPVLRFPPPIKLIVTIYCKPTYFAAIMFRIFLLQDSFAEI